MDWRATTSAQAQDDLDSLLRDSVNAAAAELAGADSFRPFMLTIGIDGLRGRRGTLVGQFADNDAVIAALEIADDRDTVRARAVAVDVVAQHPIEGDAIKVLLEHREGVAIDMLVPYRASQERLEVDLSAANAAVGAARLWG